MTARLAATMREAMRLLKTGNLGAATSAIKTGLQPAPHVHTAPPFDDAIEGSYRTFHDAPAPAFVPPKRETPWTPPRDTAPDRFITGSFSSDHGTRQYKLFVPGGHQGEPLPLVVMLHGCTQSADDFARGTRMNVLAAARPCFVLYPEQAQSANGSKCWNWFRSSDQMRDSGEPAIIAGLTREIVTTYDLDARRVYIAGLSAGGAMAVVMGEAVPRRLRCDRRAFGSAVCRSTRCGLCIRCYEGQAHANRLLHARFRSFDTDHRRTRGP